VRQIAKNHTVPGQYGTVDALRDSHRTAWKRKCHSFIRPGSVVFVWTTKNIRRQTSCVYVYVHVQLPVRDLWTSRRSLFSIHIDGVQLHTYIHRSSRRTYTIFLTAIYLFGYHWRCCPTTRCIFICSFEYV
jgi:hypothetical protein